MKKSFCAAEVYKVSFQAKEQVAAACNVSADMIQSKFPGINDQQICDVIDGKYGMNGILVMCAISEAGHMDAYGQTADYTVQYA